MALKQIGPTLPWKINNQHAGFIKTYDYRLKLFIVKGAGHEVPQYQR
jgi:hypothetical protein